MCLGERLTTLGTCPAPSYPHFVLCIFWKVNRVVSERTGGLVSAVFHLTCCLDLGVFIVFFVDLGSALSRRVQCRTNLNISSSRLMVFSLSCEATCRTRAHSNRLYLGVKGVSVPSVKSRVALYRKLTATHKTEKNILHIQREFIHHAFCLFSSFVPTIIYLVCFAALKEPLKKHSIVHVASRLPIF